MAQGLEIFFFLNRNIIAFSFHSLQGEHCFRVGRSLMSRPMWYLGRVYCGSVVSPPLSGSVVSFKPRWAALGGDGVDMGLEMWPGNTFFCWSWAIPPPLSLWRFTVLNFLFCLKALNKGRFVEDLYEARAHIWSIFQRGKIKCWT